MPGFCRDCASDVDDGPPRCRACGSPRLIRHPELNTLSIAHVDCDAFYATIEKRDAPAIRDKPVIIGGGTRGVVSTACYIARTFGVRSAMPMFKARQLCPNAIVIRPNMEKYVEVGRAVRRLMLELTPLVEPLSIDEAFIDLSGTERLHGQSPAKSLTRFAAQVEKELGITISVGLSVNKFLAKIASDLDKPRGFAVLTASEGRVLLAPKPVSFIWGVGKATQTRLERHGFRTVAELAAADEIELMRRIGADGKRLIQLARGIDHRPVSPDRETKSISAETTFNQDIASFRSLERQLWTLSERVSERLKAKQLAGATITLKLKAADFSLRTRAKSLTNPTQLAATIFKTGRELLARETDGTRFRLLGIGASGLTTADKADPADLVDHQSTRSAAAERAIDRIREKFGRQTVVKGLAFENDDE
ncbi:MAG TPA: DNA polymerase IV [Xanthobacteraceae bacterium]|jgi:DNA polymerase-4|nr:DNA polymerase IV [Xanthobacteraceae bacterium]